jgi:hypothetical protein
VLEEQQVGLTFCQIVMRELGEIKTGLADIKKDVEDLNKAMDTRLKPLEQTNKRVGWLVGSVAGFSAIMTLIIEKIGVKWLSLLS